MHGLGPTPVRDVRDIVVIGGSAGSFDPLIKLVGGLPIAFPGCVLLAVHSSPQSLGHLAQILDRASRLPVSIATHDHPIQPGIFVAPPDHHLLVTPGHIHVTHGPKENGFRPAIDPLFRTAAHSYGRRVIGILLSGALDDGVYGLREIKSRGGLTVVQDPDDAEIPNLPRTATEHVEVDHVLMAAAIAPLLIRETRLPRQGDVAMGRHDLDDPQLPGRKTDIADMVSRLGRPSGLTCPDCGGALWQIKEGNLVRYQCHVGHRYSSDSLMEQHDDRVEKALWTAVRLLEERAELRRDMASQTGAAGLAAVSEAFTEQAQSAELEADQIRELLTNAGAPGSEPDVTTVELPAGRKPPRQR